MGTSDLFCQRNELHANRPLGTAPGSTIGVHGCLLCAAARMISVATGEESSPWDFNKALVTHNGYQDGNRLVFSALTRVEERILFLERRDYSTVPFPVEAQDGIQELLDRGGMALVQVDFDPLRQEGLQPHWLQLVSIQPRARLAPYAAWLAYDPWYGEVLELGQHYSPYGRGLDYSIYALALYQLR